MEGVEAKGSILHLLYVPLFDSIEKVKAFLDEDPFVKNGGEKEEVRRLAHSLTRL
jgi:hypothetical protein